jgi:hypothetical protein
VVGISLRQLLCPDHLLGRMNATGRFLAWATLPVGGLAGGALGTALGLRTTLWLAAAGLLLSWLWLVLSPACRARDLPATRATIIGMDSQVTSRDGTSIASERIGTGPAVILVGGGLTDRSENAPLAPELAAAGFTVYNYDRRGRGASGDTPPHALARELEDLAALIAEAGGSAHLYGVSTGGALALEAAAAGLAVDRLAVYEVPYNLADDWPKRWRDYVDQLGAALAASRRGDAFALFLRLTGSSEEEIAGIRSSPFWPDAEALAHTLPYDAACLGDGRPPTDRLATIAQPALVATGVDARQPGAPAWVLALDPAADAIVTRVPHAQRRIFEGQSHVADPAAVAPVLARFFGD